ncbi:hypothetical protein [Sporomusa sphaeroides]|uniref:Uncharacterized protein n=1 Tax=Sporomusa sphaeroides DSM 2875 TaxID=1337886 RepID=A0ABM9W6Q4_9FIRM|nr:hypothetical protein [Sporomusa sphaeroides]OLS55544.1 hypothetical protein SPSPH_35920 [Sporomusa sphaeroides DSM 2875]CVK19919.1 hypothetical protein SSPH_02586 [Sporomusa sphaeroides DSM 2875]
MNTHRFRWVTPASCLCLAVFLVSISLGWLLPAEYGNENGPIEWLQVVVLGVAALVSISALFQTGLSPTRRRLFAWTSILWLLNIARELSWGRVFYPNGTGGFLRLKDIWFGPYVYPTIAIILVAAFGYFFAKGLHRELVPWLKQGILPALDFVILLVAAVTADIIEHHSSGLFGAKIELFEELGELAAYVAILCFMIDVVLNKQFRHNQPLYVFKRRGRWI